MSFPGMTFFKYFASQIFPYGKHLSSALTGSLLPDNFWQQKSSFHTGNCFLYFLYIYFCTLIISYLKLEKKGHKEDKIGTRHGQNRDMYESLYQSRKADFIKTPLLSLASVTPNILIQFNDEHP